MPTYTSTTGIAAQVASVVTTSTHDFHLPIVTAVADAGAAWVAEGDEIASSDERVITPRKLAGLTIVSRELSEDSTPAAAQVVGQSLARDMARKLDVAFFGNLGLPAPAGLGALPTAGAGAVTTVRTPPPSSRSI